MKQSKRIIAVLMALVMLFTAVPLTAYAQHTDYTNAGGYNSLDNPYVTPEQAASMLLDMVDTMLAENNMTIPIDLSILGSRTIDLRSIDQATQSITDLWGWSLIGNAMAIANLGDLENMNMTWIQQCPLRTSAGQSDLDVVIALCRFLKDNYNVVGKLIDDSFDWGWIPTFTELPPEVHNIPGVLKTSILKALNDGVEPAAGTTVDQLVQKMIDGLIIGVLDPETGKYSGLLPGMQGKTNLTTTSVYTLITDVINSAIGDIIVPMLSKLLLDLAGVEFNDEFPGGDATNAQYLDMIIGVINGFVGSGIEYTPEDLLTPLSKMTATLEYLFIDGGLHAFIYLDDTGLHVTEQMITMVDSLVRVALGLIPGLGFLKNTTVFKTADEIKTMTLTECYAYLARLLINEFVDFADIPETATNIRSVVTYLLVGLARDTIPEVDYDAMIAAGTLNPFTDGIFIVGAAMMRYYLNGLLPIDIPIGLTFEQTIASVFDWFVKPENYGGLFDTSDFALTDTVWQKIDKVIFDIIPLNWLPAEFTGSEYLLMDWLIGNILDFDYVGLMSIVKRNPTSELNQSVVTVLLNTVSRVIKGTLGNHIVLPMNLTTLDSIFSKTNFRATVQNLCLYLYDYGRSFLGTLFPLATNLIGVWTKETYLRKAPVGTPLVGIDALQNLLDSYTPLNLNTNIQYYEEGYHFFGSEDFAELRTYFNYKQAMTEARALLDAYDADPETLDLTINTDAAYRVTYYYNRLVKRNTLCANQLTKEIAKSYYADYISHETDNTYTAASFAAWKQAYNFAMTVRTNAMINKAGTTQSMVTEARHQLFLAVKGLKVFIPFADYTQLDDYIAQATTTLANLPSNTYKPASIQALVAALNTANALDRHIAGEEQESVDVIAAALYQAIYGLEYIRTPGIDPITDSATDIYGNPLTPVVNTTRKFIYGLSLGGLKIENIFPVGGATVTVTKTVQGSGTGTKVKLSFSGMIIATYTVILFGDVNGDGNIDGGDNSILIDLCNYYYNWTNNPDKRFAGDVNSDGIIDENDASIIIDCMNWVVGINQKSGEVFYM